MATCADTGERDTTRYRGTRTIDAGCAVSRPAGQKVVAPPQRGAGRPLRDLPCLGSGLLAADPHRSGAFGLSAGGRWRAAHRPHAVGRAAHAAEPPPVARVCRPGCAVHGRDRERDRLRHVHRRGRQVRDQRQQLLLPAGCCADLRRLRPPLALGTRSGGAKALYRPGAAGQRLRPGPGDPPPSPAARPQRPGARLAEPRRVAEPAGRGAAPDSGKGALRAATSARSYAPAAAPDGAEVP